MSPDDLKSAVDRWLPLGSATPGILLTEHYDLPVGAGDDYRLVYEVVVEPTEVDRARLQVAVTDDGYLTIAIETRERIARRLGVWSIYRGFAAGHEPIAATIEGLHKLMEIVALGRVTVWTTAIRQFPLSIRIGISDEDRAALVDAGYPLIRWGLPLYSLPRSRIPVLRMGSYRPWQVSQ